MDAGGAGGGRPPHHHDDDDDDEQPLPTRSVAFKRPAPRPRVLIQSIPGSENDTTGPAMFEIDGALTVAEAQQFIDAAERRGFTPQGSGGPAAGEAFRDHSRLVVRDPAGARALWERTGLRDVFKGIRVDGG